MGFLPDMEIFSALRRPIVTLLFLHHAPADSELARKYQRIPHVNVVPY
jgi:hypothetical protein